MIRRWPCRAPDLKAPACVWRPYSGAAGGAIVPHSVLQCCRRTLRQVLLFSNEIYPMAVMATVGDSMFHLCVPLLPVRPCCRVWGPLRDVADDGTQQFFAETWYGRFIYHDGIFRDGSGEHGPGRGERRKHRRRGHLRFLWHSSRKSASGVSHGIRVVALEEELLRRPGVIAAHNVMSTGAPFGGRRAFPPHPRPIPGRVNTNAIVAAGRPSHVIVTVLAVPVHPH